MSLHFSMDVKPARAAARRQSKHTPEDTTLVAKPPHNKEEDKGDIDGQKPVQRFFRR
jgi:hypothetical protein